MSELIGIPMGEGDTMTVFGVVRDESGGTDRWSVDFGQTKRMTERVEMTVR